MNIERGMLCNWGSHFCYFQVKAENDQLRGDLGLLRKQLSRKISLDDDRLQQMEIDELWEKVINYLTTFLLLILLFEGICMPEKNIYILSFCTGIALSQAKCSIVLILPPTFHKSFECGFPSCIIISRL